MYMYTHMFYLLYIRRGGLNGSAGAARTDRGVPQEASRAHCPRDVYAQSPYQGYPY